MIRSDWFPPGAAPPPWVPQLLEIFTRHEPDICTEGREPALTGEEVLGLLTPDLQAAGFQMERRAITAPKRELSAGEARVVEYQIDVYHPQWLCSLAIETPHDSSSPLMSGGLVDPLLVVDIDTFCLAMPNRRHTALNGQANGSDYDSACDLAQRLYGHVRVRLPYRLLLIGY